jgi:hypothetical protein
MKKLTLAAVILFVLTTSVSAHEGSIALYENETLTTCSVNPFPAGEYNVMILYVRGDGPEMGSAAEFKIVVSSALAIIQSVEWASYITLTLGDIFNGIAVTGQGCIGAGLNVLRLGTLNVLNLGDATRFTITVDEYPAGDPEPPAGIYITKCETGNPLHECTGGTFVFNGSCNPAAESSSWGAIKSILFE